MTTDKHGNSISQERADMLAHDIRTYTNEVIILAERVIIKGKLIGKPNTPQVEKELAVAIIENFAKQLLESATILKELI